MWRADGEEEGEEAGTGVALGSEQQKAFETLRQCLTTPPILAYADFSLPFVLHTDACGDGLSAVLCQEQDGKLRVISYANKGLSSSEKKLSCP